MVTRNLIIKCFPNFQNFFKENIKTKKKESEKYKSIAWIIIIQILLYIILIFFVFKINLLNFEARLATLYETNNEINKNKTYENSLKIKIDNNHSILINYTFDIEILDSSLILISNNISNKEENKFQTESIKNIILDGNKKKNLIVNIRNFSIYSKNITLDNLEEKDLYESLKTIFFKLKAKYWLQLFLSFLTILIGTIYLLLDKSIYLTKNFIYEITNILIEINFFNYYQVGYFLLEKYETLEIKFHLYSEFEKNLYFSLSIITIVFISYFSFLFNFFFTNKIKNFCVYFLFILFEALLINTEVYFISKDNLMNIFFQLILCLLFISITKISNSYKSLIKNKLNNKNNKFKKLKQSFNLLNFPIININSKAQFICNQSYIQEISLNRNYHKGFEIFEKTNLLFNQSCYDIDIENVVKFIFSFENIDLCYIDDEKDNKNKNKQLYKSKKKEKANKELKNDILKNDNKSSRYFALNGFNSRDDFINLFYCYKKLIEENLQDLNKEIYLNDLISKDKSHIGESRKLLIKRSCMLINETINKINLEFIEKFRFLIDRFKAENNIDKFEFLKVGEIIIMKNDQENNIPINHIKEKNINYEIYIRYNELNDSLDFTLKDKKETVLMTRFDTFDEKENNYIINLFPQLIKKICHEIRNPIINILQLVKDIKKLNFNDDHSFPKNLFADQNKKNKYVNNKNSREGTNDVYDIINNNSNMNSLRVNSLDKTLTKNSINFSFNPQINNIIDSMNQNSSFDDYSKSNSIKNLKMCAIKEADHQNINVISKNNIENNCNNSEVEDDHIYPYKKYQDIDKKITSPDNIFKYSELRKSLKKIKYLSNTINYTIKEFEFLNDIVKSNNNKNIIINELRDTFKDKIIDINLKSEIFKIKKLFDNMISMANKKLKLEFFFDDNIPNNINIDIDIIQFILCNLLTNSIKFSFSGEIKLKISYNKYLNDLSFNISDEGIGISQEYLELIGKFMFKIKNSNNEYGLGLGIYNVKLLVEALGGNFLISSKVGKGTNVYIDFKAYEKIEEYDNYISNLSRFKKISSNISLENLSEQRIYDLLGRFNELNSGLESSNEIEIKLKMNKMKRPKTTQERIRKKLSEPSKRYKLGKKEVGSKYKILVNSTNNVVNFPNFLKRKNEILANNTYLNFNYNSSNLSDKGSPIYLDYNYNNNYNTYFNRNQKKKNLLNSDDNSRVNNQMKKLYSQNTFSSNDSNSVNLLKINTISKGNSFYVKNKSSFHEDFDENKGNNINMRKNTISGDFSNKKSSDLYSNKFGKKKLYRKSKSFYSMKEINKITLFKKSQGILEFSKKSKTDIDFSLVNIENDYFKRINLNKNQNIDSPQIYFKKKNINSNYNNNLSEKFEKSFITVKNNDYNLKISYDEINSNSGINLSRNSQISISPKELYKPMKISSSINTSSPENSPINFKKEEKKEKNDPDNMQGSKTTKVLSINNSPKKFKSSLFTKKNLSILISNPDSVINLSNNINNNKNQNADYNNDPINNKAAYNYDINENKLKYSNKFSHTSKLKSLSESAIRKEKTLKFLIVDDEILIRKSQMNLIEKYFRKKKINIELTECSDGVECLFKLYEGILNGIRYDMIFTDETMNFIRGTVMASIVKSLIKENILYDVKIFMVTSYDKSILANGNGKSEKEIDYFSSKPLSIFSLEKAFSNIK